MRKITHPQATSAKEGALIGANALRHNIIIWGGGLIVGNYARSGGFSSFPLPPPLGIGDKPIHSPSLAEGVRGWVDFGFDTSGLLPKYDNK